MFTLKALAGTDPLPKAAACEFWVCELCSVVELLSYPLTTSFLFIMLIAQVLSIANFSVRQHLLHFPVLNRLYSRPLHQFSNTLDRSFPRHWFTILAGMLLVASLTSFLIQFVSWLCGTQKRKAGWKPLCMQIISRAQM